MLEHFLTHDRWDARCVQEQVPNIQETVEKALAQRQCKPSRRLLKVLQLQFSCQTVDVQLSRNVECLKLKSEARDR